MAVRCHPYIPDLDKGIMATIMTVPAPTVLKDLECLLVVLGGYKRQSSLLQDGERDYIKMSRLVFIFASTSHVQMIIYSTLITSVPSPSLLAVNSGL